MKRLSCLLSLLLASAAVQAAPPIELFAGMHRIEAEVASSNAERMTGLMNRPSLPAHRGMLFVFPEAGVQCFWMKNTLIPLSIAFLDDSGRIVQLADMQPQSLENHCSVRPVRFALEMNAGWFQRRGLAPGAKIDGIDKTPAGR
ncbi:MAG: hypothetical protein EFKGCFLK_00932 [Rhodocyclaceae bacterium]|nr:MAG: DUF192 domain-containing protein [Rhodocyclaceae bacterium]MBV6407372.1 hypothetical protein [Rhodocyclaceae bacterium]CAG0926703.1 hypothetical protein RHDC3_00125 [Rhodocyclaceae bacterium]